MAASTSSDKRQDTTNAAPGQDNTPCRTITTYSLTTAVYYRPVPQPTPVRTFIVHDGPAPSQQTPSPPVLQKRNPGPDGPSDGSLDSTINGKTQSESSSSFAWKDVFAVQHVTTMGNCPTPTSSPPLPTTTNHPTPDHDLNAAHKVNIHLAILVGGLTVGIIVVTILIAVAGCILCTRRRRRKANAGKQLSDVDDTLTCRSNHTTGSSRTTMSERRLKCQTGWQMKDFSHQGMHSPFCSGDISPSSCDKVEILARSGTTSHQSQDRASLWADPAHSALRGNPPESLSDTCSTDAPSYFPGDDMRYTMPQCSTSALTEVSCAATIDSNSNSVCTTRLHPPTLQSSGPSTPSPTVTSNLNSLIRHKAFLSSMMGQRNLHLEPPHPHPLPPPDPALTPKSRPHSLQSFAGSVYTDSTHESMYWINRPKS